MIVDEENVWRDIVIRIAICDSLAGTAERIKLTLERLYHNRISIVVCESIFALEHYVLDEMNGNVDIIFMDVNMPEVDSIAVIREIQKDYSHIQAAFLAYDEKEVWNIFQADPACFLKKPVDDVQLQDAMNRMLVKIHEERKRILVFESRKGVLLIPVDEILYVESDKREFTIVMTRNRRERGYGKMEQLLERLPGNFIRCHQSYIVNIDKIWCFSNKEIILMNQQKIPVSRPRCKSTKEAMMNYLILK